MHVNWVDSTQTSGVSTADRGLLYGDGLFETMAVVDGSLPLWQLHAERLLEGCRRLGLESPSIPALQADILPRIHGLSRAILKLILTRGVGGRGYAIAPDTQANMFLQLHPWSELPVEYWTRGVKIRFCALRLSQQPALAGIKHLNRLEQVLARREWSGEDIQEGLLADCDGNIIEAVSHNVFMLQGERFRTPGLEQCGVAGVMREQILRLLRARGLEAELSRIDKHALLNADAVFLCNSIHGIWPVCELESRFFTENRLVCELREEIARLIPYR